MSVATGMYACRADDVPLGEGRAIMLGGRRIAIFRSPAGWFALDAACPHRGGPLADGIVCDTAVICPLHDRRYDLASGEALNAADVVAAHSVRLHGESVFVTLAVSAPIAA